MITAKTRQNSNMNWWSSATFNGYDYSEEATTIIDSQLLLAERLNEADYKGHIHFEHPTFYVGTEIITKPVIGYSDWRIDRECRSSNN